MPSPPQSEHDARAPCIGLSEVGPRQLFGLALLGLALLGLFVACGPAESKDSAAEAPGPTGSNELTSEERPGTETESKTSAFETLVAARAGSYGERPIPERLAVEVAAAGLGRTVVLLDTQRTDQGRRVLRRARINFEREGRTLLRDEESSLVAWSAEDEPAPASDEQRQAFAQVYRLCELGLMFPLESLTEADCRFETAAEQVVLIGDSLRVELDPRDRAPRLVRRIDELAFVRFARAGRGMVPIELRDDELGPIAFRILAHDLLFDESSFAEPTAASDATRRLVEPIRNASVRTTTRRAAELLLIPDPGRWPARFDALNSAGTRLARGRFRPAGEDAALVMRGEERFLQIAFLDPSGEGQLELMDGEIRESRPEARAIAVQAPDGDWTRRIDLAEAALRASLDEQESDGRPPELLFNHRTRSQRTDGDLMLETMPVELRQGLR